jgi:hypothetical protein
MLPKSVTTVETAIRPLLRVHPRFLRSVHLEQDLKDPSSSLGYILTPVAQQALDRITASFRHNSTQRAWRVTGDYGSGKSDFGLILARIAKGALEELPNEVRQFRQPNTFLPLVATGDSEPLGVTVLRALERGPVTRNKRPSTEEVLRAVQEAVIDAQQNQFSGVLLIVDELGKNLEYAARNPESDDVFLLQRLAEEAARSADKPFVIVAILHQGVAAYAAGLDSAARREWDKVAGRFEEIVFAQPIEQTAALVAATLNVDIDQLPDSVRKESEISMAAALKAGLYGSSAGLSASDLGPRIFPLHPTVLPVLSRIMRRFGQNERSLFSFISSAEPMGLQSHIARCSTVSDHYRIHHLFDYVRNNLLPTLTTGSAHTHWGIIEAVLASTPVESFEEEAVLKTVAMLSLLDASDLPATEEVILLAVGGEQELTEKAVTVLRNRGTLYERGSVSGLCLWPHTSVNLDESFEKAIAATAHEADGIKLLCEHVQSEHLVPRAYYVETGTLRYAEVKLLPSDRLTELLASPPELDGKRADLNLRVILPADKARQNAAIQLLHNAASRLPDGLIIAIAEPPGPAIAALTDLVAWEWVRKNTPELSGDRFAREEVTRQIGHAAKNLRARLNGLDNLAVPNPSPLHWFSISGTWCLPPGRKLLAFLGEECRRIYSRTPKIFNELINRQAPSSAAIAARSKLVEAMATFPDKAFLGMDETKRPPEMALYLSILQAGGFHVESESGWVFRAPLPEDDKCNLLPALNLITSELKTSGVDALVPVPQIFDALSRPPFGIREGLQPFILAIYLATHHQRVALYEDGTYLHEVGGEEFLRLAKEPQSFHLQYCALEGMRADVFAKLLELLQLGPRDANNADLIDLVRPLVIFISREVPEYSRKTNNLSAIAVSVRRALLEAREPIRLVFTLLPEACGLPPVGEDGLGSPDELASRLRTALHDIRTAYSKLINRIGDALRAAFDITAGISDERRIIASRAEQLAAVVTEPSLKAFARRLADTTLEDRVWIESIANLLARKSPERWTDNDETEFHHQLEVAAGRFKRTELALIGTTRKLNGHACRIALTKSDGTEVGDLINWDGMDENRIQHIEEQLQNILSSHGRHGLAAAMRALWRQLQSESKPKEP